jgi:hypothetical protein
LPSLSSHIRHTITSPPHPGSRRQCKLQLGINANLPLLFGYLETSSPILKQLDNAVAVNGLSIAFISIEKSNWGMLATVYEVGMHCAGCSAAAARCKQGSQGRVTNEHRDIVG